MCRERIIFLQLISSLRV